MNKLDSILSKLRVQNTSITHRSIESISTDQHSANDQSGNGTNMDDLINKDDQIRVNKRKNFKPKVVRTCDDQLDKVRESTDTIVEGISCNGELDLNNPVNRKRNRRYDYGTRLSKEEEYNPEPPKCPGVYNGRSVNSDDMEEGTETPGLLAIVESDERAGTDSGRSSNNSSTCIFDNADLDLSPDLLLNVVTTAFNDVVQSQSPISTMASSPVPNKKYSQQRIIDPPDPDQNGNERVMTISTATRPDQEPSPVVSYIVRFMNNDCGVEKCRFTTSREHFHCKLCNNKLFTKKEEMLRHYKWHRKREESLAYGFMRYSACDDCSQTFTHCVHNLRQTHYHCLQDSCDKVYISTSDVQMHANSHRKQAHIAKEGFQRVKGSEKCTYNACPFTDPSNRTTHFHCLRPACTHSFKNKADMDKHKAHHMKDEQLTKDGFKKYMKSEACFFGGCAFSRVVNHIHCIRPACDYVLHSTSQMYSHKRKHEKQDKRVNDYVTQQQAIANAFKSAAVLMNAANGSINYSSTSPSPSSSNTSSLAPQFTNDTGQLPSFSTSTFLNGASNKAGHSNDQSSSSATKKAISTVVQNRLKLKQYDPLARTFHDAGVLDQKESETKRSHTKVEDLKKVDLFDSDDMGIDMTTLQSPIQFMKNVTKADTDSIADTEDQSTVEFMLNQSRSQFQQIHGRGKGDDSWKKFITRYTANDPCIPLCPLLYKDHYHCTAGEGCKMTFKSKDGVRDHAKQHEQLCMAIEHFREFVATETCTTDGCTYNGKELHYHCLWDNCTEAIGSSEPVFRRLEHHKVHEYSNQLINDSRANAVFTPNSPLTRKWNTDQSVSKSGSTSQATDAFKRKRGRPPKYNILDLNVNSPLQIGQSQDILLTNFKLPKIDSSHVQLFDQQRSSPSSQSRRGRPRTVSSPKHSSIGEPPSDSNLQETNANILLQQQAQLELLRLWNNNLNSIAQSALLSSPLPDPQPTVSTSTKRPQFDGFTTYTAIEKCPDALCRYRAQLHYHCRLPRCFYSSNRDDQLELHRRDFHDAFEIPDAYVCYDRSYNCRHTSCQYNGQARHFHCQTAGCSAALLKFNELTEHTSKGHNILNHDQQFVTAQHSFQDDSDKFNIRNQTGSAANVIRTSGIFFPEGGTDATAVNNAISPEQSAQQPSTSIYNTVTFSALAQSLSPALSLFKAAAALGIGPVPTSFPTIMNTPPNGLISPNKALPYTLEQQCGRPFCKLKRRVHYHCTLCHQGFSHFDRLTVHMQKHGISLPPLLSQQVSPASSQHSTVSPHVKAAVQAVIADQQRSTTISNQTTKNHSESKTLKLDQQAEHDLKRPISPSGTSQAAKKMKFHVFQPKAMKFEENEGRVGTDSAMLNSKIAEPLLTAIASAVLQPKAKGSTKQASKSLQRKSGGVNGPNSDYTASHSGISTVDPNPKIATMEPNRQSDIMPKKPPVCADDLCPRMAGSALHYHCDKCDFWTPESTKWYVHSKQHARMDQVAALGFKKVIANSGNTNGADMNKSDSNIGMVCPLSKDCSLANQSHYHCVKCKFVAFNQSQMSAHKTTKHAD